MNSPGALTKFSDRALSSQAQALNVLEPSYPRQLTLARWQLGWQMLWCELDVLQLIALLAPVWIPIGLVLPELGGAEGRGGPSVCNGFTYTIK